MMTGEPKLPIIKMSRERTIDGIDWPSIISLMVAARAKDPETTIFQPFTTSYLNDLVETAVEFAKEAARSQKAHEELIRKMLAAERLRADKARPEMPNCPCTVTPEAPGDSQREATGPGEEIERAINRFSRDMEARMRANSHKGNWRDSSRGHLLDKLTRALDDLSLAHSGRTYPQTIIRRAADVANYAMMIADQETNKISAEKARDEKAREEAAREEANRQEANRRLTNYERQLREAEEGSE